MNRRKTFRRIGCALLLIPWIVFLFSPCAILALAINQEIKITWSDIPDDAFRIWTISERYASGLGIANARRVSAPNDLTCTIIDVQFVLWRGSADEVGALPSHQCACYKREQTRWAAAAVGPEACKLAGE